MPLHTIAVELVPPNVEDGAERAIAEAHKLREYAGTAGLQDRIKHVMIPGLIGEEEDRPVEMKPKLDVLDFWSLIQPELPGVGGLCTQVTAFMPEPVLAERLARLRIAGIDGIVFVGVPRTMQDGEGPGVAPTEALSRYDQLVRNRGVILIPTRAGELDRFGAKCERGATFGMTQLLYSDAIVGFLTEFARHTGHRPEILLSFGFVPKAETRIGLINWLIKDAGNEQVAREQAFVAKLAEASAGERRKLMVELYQQVIDGVVGLGFPLSLHLEAPYGISAPAFETFAEMVAYWAPGTS